MANLISIIDDQGVERFLGNLEPEGPLRCGWTVYGDVPQAPLIPRSRWPELVAAFPEGPEHPFRPYVHEQDGVGQCNCDATTAMMEFARAAAGLPFVKLSAADLYHRINGGRDQGSMLEDALEEASRNGVGTAETCGTLWARGFRQATAEERLRFRILEAYLCPTFDHCYSAVLSGFALDSGVMWAGNYKPDRDGWLPSFGSGRGGGHAVMGYKPAMRNGKYGIWHQNSWGESWGLNGCCVFPESIYGREIGGIWAVRAVVDEGGAMPPPAAA